MKVLYAVLNMGLGHATRSLGIIQSLISNNVEITIVSTGRSLEFLKSELLDENYNLQFIDYPDYGIKYSKKLPLIIKFLFQAPMVLKRIVKEHKFAKNILKKKDFDFVVSDHRYGFFYKNITSFFITHQITLMPPIQNNFLKKISTKIHSIFLRNFNYVVVPDFEDEINLSGELSHFIIPKKINVFYAGPLYSFVDDQEFSNKEELDVLCIISGPEPQRTVMEKKIIPLLKNYSGKSVAVLGKPESDEKIVDGNLTIYSHLNRDKLQLLIKQSKIVVSRSGYTTVMELAGLKKRAVFIPTPGQTEQKYLANYLAKKNWFGIINQNKIEKLFSQAIFSTKDFSGFPLTVDVKKNYQKVTEFILSKI